MNCKPHCLAYIVGFGPRLDGHVVETIHMLGDINTSRFEGPHWYVCASFEIETRSGRRADFCVPDSCLRPISDDALMPVDDYAS